MAKTGSANRRHSVYVVELHPSVQEDRRFARKFAEANPGHDSSKECLYVGMTGLTPEQRFENHKTGIKSGRGYVRHYGIQLRPDLYEHLNPMTYETALEMESTLADRLRRKGYGVWQK
jgi:hypothetical protein